MRIAFVLVGVFCLGLFFEFVYFLPHDAIVIILAAFAFIPYALMSFVIAISRKVHDAFLGGE